MTQNNQYVDQQLNQVIEDVHKIASLQMLDREVEAIISKEYQQKGMEYILDVRVMNAFIQMVTSLKSPYYGVAYVGVNGEFYSNMSFEFDLSEDVYAQVLKSHIKSDEIITISPSVDLYGKKSIIFTRTLLNSKDLQQKGYCMVSLSLKELNSYLSLRSINGKSNNDFDSEFVVASNDELITHIGTQIINNEDFMTDIKPVLKGTWDDGIKDITINSNRLLFTKEVNDVTGWTILQYKPISMINSLMFGSLFVYLWTMLPLFIAFIIIARYVTKKVIRPIDDMTQAMTYLEKGEFMPIDEKSIGNDEMGFMMNSYNKTIKKLETTIQKQYIAELYEKKAELKMLESQINPHFMYNALNTMSSIAEINNIGEISDMAGSLSELLRFNLQEGSIITVEEELAQVDNHFNIQKVRFKDKLTLIKNIDEELLGKPILKFLIQPLVENAIFHGLEKKKSKGQIVLNIKKQDSFIYIQVEDNGVGIAKDQLELLKSRLLGTSKDYINRNDYESIGLENVNYRMKDYYGQEYGLVIESELNKYTTVSFYIPLFEGD